MKSIYKYNELRELEDKYWNSLSDEVQHQMLLYNDVSFESWVLSNANEGDIIEIDYDNYSYEIIGKYEL